MEAAGGQPAGSKLLSLYQPKPKNSLSSSSLVLLPLSNSQADCGLESVVNPPLQTREGTDHDDTGAKAAPDAGKAELGEDLSCGFAALGHLGDDGVGGVRHNGARDAGNVASQRRR